MLRHLLHVQWHLLELGLSLIHILFDILVAEVITDVIFLILEENGTTCHVKLNGYIFEHSHGVVESVT